MEKPKIVNDAMRVVAVAAVSFGSIVALEAPASAWQADTNAEVHCVTGPGTGDVVADVSFANQETNPDQGMNVSLEVSNQTISFGTVQAGETTTEEVDLGPAPTDEQQGTFTESWVDQKQFGEGTDTRTVDIPAEKDICPTPTTTTTTTVPPTTTTTTPETSTTTTSTTVPKTTTTKKPIVTTTTHPTSTTLGATTTTGHIEQTPNTLPRTGNNSSNPLSVGLVVTGVGVALGGFRRDSRSRR